VDERPKRKELSLYQADLLMVLLCSLTSFWLLVSPLVQYTFYIDTTSGLVQFLVADLIVSAVLGTIGVTLNHLSARNVRVTLRRRR
jgi:hypothetical protein